MACFPIHQNGFNDVMMILGTYKFHVLPFHFIELTKNRSEAKGYLFPSLLFNTTRHIVVRICLLYFWVVKVLTVKIRMYGSSVHEPN